METNYVIILNFCGGYLNIIHLTEQEKKESEKYDKNIKVVLGKDWIAQEHTEYTTSFGEGVGFRNGRIEVPASAKITLDLNGKTINRDMVGRVETAPTFGNVIGVAEGELTILDSCYNETIVSNLYETNKTNKEALFSAIENLNCGKIIGGYAPNGGGIYIYAKSRVTFSSGIMFNNKANYGGAIYNLGLNLVVNGGIFYNNVAKTDAGGIYMRTNSNINGGYFINNSATFGGAIYQNSHDYGHNVTNAIFAYNLGTKSGGASYTYHGTAKIQNSTFYRNEAKLVGGALSGAGLTSIMAVLDIYNCTITENTADSGGAISANANQSAKLQIILAGGVITQNTAKTYAGGVFVRNIDYFTISGPVQIYDNKLNNATHSDAYIEKGKKIEINGVLATSASTAYIGITLAPNYGDVPFTIGYKYKGNTIGPGKIFFSNNTNYGIELKEDEAILSTTTTKPTEKCEWILTPENGTPIKTTGTNITVPYNGKKYTLTNSKGLFTQTNNSTKLTSFDGIKLVGSFGFDTDANVLNPVVTITVVPKEVELEWTNTSLTYNGASQIPIATIKASDLVAGDECTITVSGAQTLAGNYIATISTINNSNYKLKPSVRKYTEFTIAKANLTIDVTTKNISKEYNGKIVDIGNDWYNITTNGLLGVDRGKAIDKLFNIDTKAFVPQFNGNESVVEVGEYIISTKPFTVSEVFKDNLNYNVNINYVNTGKLTITNPSVIRPTDNSGYDFMMLQNNKRVSYKEKELIHGDNDSEYTNFVLGNIAPNTSVQTLLNNLVFSDMSQVQIYNGANEVVYGENAKAFYTANIDNGTELAVGTGWYIRYEKLTGGEETIYLSVLGDLTGDGKVNSADVNRLRQMVNNIEVYTNSNEVVKLSSLIINNGKTPTNADAEIVWNVVCGKIDIADFI